MQSVEKETVLEAAIEPNGAAKVGRILKSKREEKKLSLEDVCEILKIRKFFLESIEKGQLDQLPGSVYTIGFVKVYSRFLGVNFEEISSHLVELTEVSHVDVPLSTYHLPPPKSLLTRWSIVLSIFLVTLAFGYFYLTHERETKSVILEASKIKEEVPKPVEAAVINPQLQPQADTALVADESSLVTIMTTKETWIKITDGTNQLVVARLLRSGTYYQIESRPGLLLTAGEASALQIYLGNKRLSRSIPQHAGLLEAFPIDAENLKTYIDAENVEGVQ